MVRRRARPKLAVQRVPVRRKVPLRRLPKRRLELPYRARRAARLNRLLYVALQKPSMRAKVCRTLKLVVPKPKKPPLRDPPVPHKLKPSRLWHTVARLTRHPSPHAQRRLLPVRPVAARDKPRVVHVLRNRKQKFALYAVARLKKLQKQVSQVNVEPLAQKLRKQGYQPPAQHQPPPLVRQLRGVERRPVKVRKFADARPLKHVVYRQLYVVVARQKKKRLLHRQGLKQHLPNAKVQK